MTLLASSLLALALAQLPGGDWGAPTAVRPTDYPRSMKEHSDLDGDGQNDLVGIFYDTQTFEIRCDYLSGEDLSLLASYSTASGSFWVESGPIPVGDTNGDGHSEIALRLYDRTLRDYFVVVLDGADASELARIPTPPNYQWARFGQSIEGNADFDQDGLPDLFIGAPQAQGQVGLPADGSVFVYRSSDWQLVHQIIPARKYRVSGFGWSLRVVPDRDGDGQPDLAVGAVDPRRAAADHVVIVGSLQGQFLQIFEHAQVVNFGIRIEVVGDLDRDGTDDLLVANSGLTHNHWRVYSGRTGKQISGAEEVGDFIRLGDLDRDGVAELYQLPSKTYRSLVGGVRLRAPQPNDFNPVCGLTLRDGTRALVTWRWQRGELEVGRRFQTWIDTDVQEVEASSGGSLAITLDFGASESGHSYRVLCSLRGVGLHELAPGMAIPLLPDAWTKNSWHGNYGAPNQAIGMHGTLGAMGEATASITFPPGALSKVSGKALHICAVTQTGSGALSRSSAVRSVVIRQ